MIDKFTPEMKEYFDSLPPMYQETIVQSGAKLATMDDLERFVQHVEDSGK